MISFNLRWQWRSEGVLQLQSFLKYLCENNILKYGYKLRTLQKHWSGVKLCPQWCDKALIISSSCRLGYIRQMNILLWELTWRVKNVHACFLWWLEGDTRWLGQRISHTAAPVGWCWSAVVKACQTWPKEGGRWTSHRVIGASPRWPGWSKPTDELC